MNKTLALLAVTLGVAFTAPAFAEEAKKEAAPATAATGTTTDAKEAAPAAGTPGEKTVKKDEKTEEQK